MCPKIWPNESVHLPCLFKTYNQSYLYTMMNTIGDKWDNFISTTGGRSLGSSSSPHQLDDNNLLFQFQGIWCLLLASWSILARDLPQYRVSFLLWLCNSSWNAINFTLSLTPLLSPHRKAHFNFCRPTYFYFICMHILPALKCLHLLCFWCLRRSGEGTGSPRTGIRAWL